jgi:quercetin dioxygenase-like cupin family protein
MALHHAQSGEVVDLRPLGPDLRKTPTTALVKSDSFEAVRLVVPAETAIPSHHVDGRFTLHCLEGRVRLDIDGKDTELAAGQWVYVDRGVPHSVEGIEDASLLLTILFDPR